MRDKSQNRSGMITNSSKEIINDKPITLKINLVMPDTSKTRMSRRRFSQASDVLSYKRQDETNVPGIDIS